MSIPDRGEKKSLRCNLLKNIVPWMMHFLLSDENNKYIRYGEDAWRARWENKIHPNNRNWNTYEFKVKFDSNGDNKDTAKKILQFKLPNPFAYWMRKYVNNHR